MRSNDGLKVAVSDRGHLKIFFGYALGSGKTHAMLTAALAARRKKQDVVIGVIAV